MPNAPHNPALRGRIESVVRLASPLLDLVIAVGERVSRVVDPDDPSYVPARMPREGASAPRGLRPRS